MKRMHLHVAVDDLAQSIGFYSTLFGAGPSVRRDDYAKWMLDDPRVNFAISQRGAITGAATGLDHIGIQAESDAELREIAERLTAADLQTLDQEATECCYAVSDKTWVSDPSGLRWETFHTTAESTIYGESTSDFPPPSKSACCAA